MSRRKKHKFIPLKKNDPPVDLLIASFSKFNLNCSKKSQEINTKIQKDNFQQRKTIIPKITVEILSTYNKCNNEYTYDKKHNPRRWVTKNHKRKHNQGYDNSKYELIMKVHDVLDGGEHKFSVLDGMGAGQFGQVVKCRILNTQNTLVAIKIVKSHRAYFNQALLEINIHQTIAKYLQGEKIVRYLHHFLYRNHLSIVFELLSVNLLQLIKLNHYRGFSIRIVRKLATQLLDALVLLYDTGIVHCDIKPENILLEHPKKTNIKIIDFGSACYIHQTSFDYIQSRFYRAPEVILKMPYSQPIDMWSFGCVVAEIYLGLPLLPGVSEYEQLLRIIETIGPIPPYLLKRGGATTKYYNIVNDEFQFKSVEQFSIENQIRATEPRKYFNYKLLSEIIMNAPYRKKYTNEELKRENINRACLVHFLIGCFQIDPDKRWTPKEAKQHPFITGLQFNFNFKPNIERTRLYYTPPKEQFVQTQFLSKYMSTPVSLKQGRKLQSTMYRKKEVRNNNNNNQIDNSESSESSSHSELDIIPNFSFKPNSRFNSSSFMMKRSPNPMESCSGSDSSEFELYMNIRRAKRSFGYGVVSNTKKQKSESKMDEKINKQNYQNRVEEEEEKFLNNSKKKRRMKIKSWSDGKEEPFSNKNLDEIDIFNSPQQLQFARKLSLNSNLSKKNNYIHNSPYSSPNKKKLFFRKKKKSLKRNNNKKNDNNNNNNNNTNNNSNKNKNNNNLVKQSHISIENHSFKKKNEKIVNMNVEKNEKNNSNETESKSVDNSSFSPNKSFKKFNFKNKKKKKSFMKHKKHFLKRKKK
ncbi:homeodomain interacting protein kinase isoform a [Anaeramoeba flamelloides]|uniref:Homeodomain interacting protein kinase isoform a n=1 Tax=Anaeramoeba flamelloides TaxID=1746091 RepID=A0AAV7YAH9_9EUKA|nr:homeodomain interacting protein kinase isoform a [Anaeramoeba flamelloides]